MKRLQCLYKPNKDKNYPWALKHPKVDSPLAIFKTRNDAMNWFLSLGYDCATWFKNDQNVWGGLVIAEKNQATGQMEYELSVEKFDGKLDYDQTLKELNINQDGSRDEKAAQEALANVRDYRVLNDHHNYFPVDDDLVIERKKSKKDLEIEELKARILDLQGLLSQATPDVQNQIARLLEQLQDTNADREALKKEIEMLQSRSNEVIIQETKVVEKPVQKEVIKEVIKEVLVSDKEITKYYFIEDLSNDEKVKVLALYAKKLEKLLAELPESTITSHSDLTEIQSNLNLATGQAKMLNAMYKEDDDYGKLVKLVGHSLTKSLEAFKTLVIASDEIKDSVTTAVYASDENGDNVRVAQLTSYALLDAKQVGFVPKNKYTYAILANSVQVAKFLVFDWPVEKQVEVPAMVQTQNANNVITIAQEDNSLARYASVFVMAAVYTVLLALVLVLALGLV